MLESHLNCRLQLPSISMCLITLSACIELPTSCLWPQQIHVSFPKTEQLFLLFCKSIFKTLYKKGGIARKSNFSFSHSVLTNKVRKKERNE